MFTMFGISCLQIVTLGDSNIFDVHKGQQGPCTVYKGATGKCVSQSSFVSGNIVITRIASFDPW